MVSGVAYAIFIPGPECAVRAPRPPLKKGLPASPKLFLKTRDGIMVTRLSCQLRVARGRAGDGWADPLKKSDT